MTVTATPKIGEKTKPQNGRADVASAVFALEGFGNAPRATYALYRRMRSNPTVALARMVATSPVRHAEWSYEADTGIPNDWVHLIETTFERLRPTILKESMRALDYGWQPFERIYAYRDGALVIDRLKPLLPDLTRIIVNDRGAFSGLQNLGEDLMERDSWVFTYDGEAGDLHGRSRHENIRDVAWWPWMQLATRLGKYADKVSGAIPFVRYLTGKGHDANGAEKDNFELATDLIKNLGKMHGVAFPMSIPEWAHDLLRSGADLKDLLTWQIDFLESKGQHGGDLVTMMRHFESLMLRGWLVPERTATEGQHGTKAESETQADLVIAAGEELLEDLTMHCNSTMVDDLLELNFGRDARGKVRIAPAPLIDEKAQLIRRMVEKVLGETPALMLEAVDLDAAIDQVGLPKLNDVVDNDALKEALKSSRPSPPGLPGASPFQFPSMSAQLQAVYGGIHEELRKTLALTN